MKLRPLILVALGAAFCAGAPAAAATDAPVYYVSLGDSLATGWQPIAPRCAGRPGVSGSCETDRGYVDQLYEIAKADIPALKIKRFGCGGATTTTMIAGGGSCRYVHGSQLAEALHFIESRRRLGEPAPIAFITIDIGGNDGFEFGCYDDFDLACLTDQMDDTLAANLATILTRLRQAAGPDVPIVGMSYYDPFLGLWTSGLDDLAKRSVDWTVAFNDRLEAAYQAAGAAVADVEGAFAVTAFEPLVDDPRFGQLPLNVHNTCRWVWACRTDFFDVHANDDGHGVIARAFADVLMIDGGR